MVAIPLPFVVSFLLLLLAAIVFVHKESNERPAVAFLTLSAVTTAIVGLRWTTDIALFRFLMPVCASTIPVAAWYSFTRAHSAKQFYAWHWLAPLLMVVAMLMYPFWRPPIDPFLTLLYVAYGAALIRSSLGEQAFPTQVRLGDAYRTQIAERLAGGMLLLSAVIDGAFALDFGLYEGQHAMVILTLGYALILPILALLVIFVSQTIPVYSDDSKTQAAENRDELNKSSQPMPTSQNEAKQIVEQIDALMKDKRVYLDPDLTLDRLARKSLIPSRQISTAINQIYNRNISQVINEYRISHAQLLLATTDDSITQIYLNSGFHTKSNFNREFLRVTEQTPSAYRRAVKTV